MGDVWTNCIHLKNGQNYHIEENLKGQREIWIEKIAEIFKELNKRDLNKFRNIILDNRKSKNSKNILRLFKDVLMIFLVGINCRYARNLKIGQS